MLTLTQLSIAVVDEMAPGPDVRRVFGVEIRNASGFIGIETGGDHQAAVKMAKALTRAVQAHHPRNNPVAYEDRTDPNRAV